MPGTRYSHQRARRLPPHVSLADLRNALRLTIDDVRARMAEEMPGEEPPTRGAISGIENGHRGVSQQMLDALTAAYGLRPGAITTDYAPRTFAEKEAG
jgi:transcriptional regulator with XRE-family HTH domain